MTSPLSNPAFRRWFGDSKVVDASGEPLVVYHGTGVRPFDVFAAPVHDPVHFSEWRQVPFGIHFAEEMQQAETHRGNIGAKWRWQVSDDAHAVVERQAKQLGYKSFRELYDLASKSPEKYAKHKQEMDRAWGAAYDEALVRRMGGDYRRVLPVYLSIQRPLDATERIADVTGRLRDLVFRLLLENEYNPEFATERSDFWSRRLGGSYDPLVIDVIDAVEPKTALREIVNAGYDGIFYFAKYPGRRLYKTWVAFDPRQIKHATENVGTYDPQDPNMYKNPRRKRTSRRRT